MYLYANQVTYFQKCVKGSLYIFYNVNFDQDHVRFFQTVIDSISSMQVYMDNLNIFKNVLLFCVWITAAKA
jgi:hypothetical protein